MADGAAVKIANGGVVAVTCTPPRVRAGLVAVTLGVLLAGCSSIAPSGTTVAATTSAGATGVAAMTEPPAPTPSVAPVVAGQVLTAEQAQGCIGGKPVNTCKLPLGSRAFPMPDGTYVAVLRNDPIPAPVAAVLQAEVTSVHKASSATSDQTVAAMDSAKAYAAKEMAATGKRVVTVTTASGTDRCVAGATIVIGWVFLGIADPQNKCIFSADKASAVAHAQALIAASGEANLYVLVVQP